jgi:hypothetical protein
VLCATSFPCVIVSVTMPYFGHNEDMHRFWSMVLFRHPMFLKWQINKTHGTR